MATGIYSLGFRGNRMQAGVETVHCNQCGLASTSDAGFCQRCGAKLPAFAPAPLFDLSQPLYAGFWIRFVAALIDMIVLFTFLLSGLYRAGMESSEYQGTLGKLAMRIKVTDLAYQRLSLADATKRS